MTPSYLRELVIANRILANEGVVDAFGHASIRSPENAARYFMSRSRAPELVTVNDLMEFTLGGEAIDLQGRTPYAERMIHGALYEARSEVNAVIHNHAYDVIPFGVTWRTLEADHAYLWPDWIGHSNMGHPRQVWGGRPFGRHHGPGS